MKDALTILLILAILLLFGTLRAWGSEAHRLEALTGADVHEVTFGSKKDSQYQPVPFYVFSNIVKRINKTLAATPYKAQIFDCDDYVAYAQGQLALDLYRTQEKTPHANLEAGFSIFKLMVTHKEAQVGHVALLVNTTQGTYVYDPTNQYMMTLQDYEKKYTIRGVLMQ